VQVTFALAEDPGTAIDRSPVTVRVTGEERRGALTVPVTALLALAEGGYAVEAPGAGGPRLVPVETGMFAGPFVEVTGADVAEGMRVVVPT
ncbi:MAG TPA: hypothetical protein VHK88_14510, partial [Aquihabitans sp.]|nr:hypothetical protein [Aquihabitans sp.]